MTNPLQPGCVLTAGSTTVEVLGPAFQPSHGPYDWLQRVKITEPVRVWYAPWRKRVTTRDRWVDPGSLVEAWNSGQWKVGVKDNAECWAELEHAHDAGTNGGGE